MKTEYRTYFWKHTGILAVCFLLAAVGLHAQYSDHRGYRTDSLEQVLRDTPPQEAESLARIYKALMWAYSETDDGQSMKYARLLEGICRRENFTLAHANSLRMIGVQHYGRCQYDSALHYLQLALEASAGMEGDDRYEPYQMEDEQAMAYGAIGNVYNMQGMNTLAIENYEKVMRICEKYHWNESLATVALNISELYFGMGNHIMAEEYVNRLDSLAQLSGDSLFIAKAHIEKGILYRSGYSDYDRALQHAEAAAAYLLNNPEEGTWKITCMHLLASLHLLKGNLTQAEEIIIRQLRMAEEMESPYDIASALAQQAELHSHRNEWSRVMETGERALSYNDMEPENTLGIYKLLGEAAVHSGNGNKAMAYYDKALELQASWSNENHQSALAEQKVRYETEQKEVRITSLEQEKRLMTWLAVSGGALALLILLLLFYLNRLHRHQKRLLATQVALESETAERKRIARDLHDGLGGILSLAKLQLNGSHPDQAGELLDKAHREMRRVAHHIMPEALMKQGLVTALEDFIAAVPNASFHFFGEEGRLETSIEALLYRAAYELVNNALKHAHATGIDVQLILQPHNITLSISDNGCGFDTVRFQPGFGLKNISNRLAAYGGKMLLESHPHQGTDICIEIPIP